MNTIPSPGDLSVILNRMSIAILREIRKEGWNSVVDPSTENSYRRLFKRVSVRKNLLEPWNSQIDTSVMAVEIIGVYEASDEVHYHDHAFAIITILGPDEGVLEPEGALFAFGSTLFQPAASGITLEVKPGKLHGFSSPFNAYPILFLSVQSRKISEDFHIV